jgi:hypothetical protein
MGKYSHFYVQGFPLCGNAYPHPRHPMTGWSGMGQRSQCPHCLEALRDHGIVLDPRPTGERVSIPKLLELFGPP